MGAKPKDFAVEILRHFDLYDYFDFVAGATMNDVRNKKEDIIRYAMENCHMSDKSSAVMIGDREHDIIGAKENGLDSILLICNAQTCKVIEFPVCRNNY